MQKAMDDFESKRISKRPEKRTAPLQTLPPPPKKTPTPTNKKTPTTQDCCAVNKLECLASLLVMYGITERLGRW